LKKSKETDLSHFVNSPINKDSFLRKQESRAKKDSYSEISGFPLAQEQAWIPACAGMTFF